MITARTPKEREGKRGREGEGAFDKGKWMARETAAARGEGRRFVIDWIDIAVAKTWPRLLSLTCIPQPQMFLLPLAACIDELNGLTK